MRKSILTASKEWTPAYARVTKARGGVNKLRSEAFATDEHGITRKRGGNPFPSFSRMRKSILTASKEWTPAYARVTKARGGVNKLRSEAFATDEHGITRKRGGNPFPSFSRMRKSILTASKEWTPAYARVTKARIRREISHSHREDAKSAKENKKS